MFLFVVFLAIERTELVITWDAKSSFDSECPSQNSDVAVHLRAMAIKIQLPFGMVTLERISGAC